MPTILRSDAGSLGRTKVGRTRSDALRSRPIRSPRERRGRPGSAAARPWRRRAPESFEFYHVGQAGELQQLLAHVVDAGCDASEHKIGVARDPPALQEARHRRHRGLERLDRGQGLAVELDQDEGRHLIAEQPFVERGADRLDHAAAAQGADPAQAGRGGDADPLGQLVDPDPAVPLQLGQDPQIDVIELWAFCHSHEPATAVRGLLPPARS